MPTQLTLFAATEDRPLGTLGCRLFGFCTTASAVAAGGLRIFGDGIIRPAAILASLERPFVSSEMGCQRFAAHFAGA
jgi:hypothetical protein